MLLYILYGNILLSAWNIIAHHTSEKNVVNDNFLLLYFINYHEIIVCYKFISNL